MTWRHAIPFRPQLRWALRQPDYWLVARRDWPKLAAASFPGRPRGGEATIRAAALGGRPIVIRLGTTDAEIAWSAFCLTTHLPTRTSPRRIWDIGANIGLTAAHLACLFPDARVVALEPDPDNARLARVNTAPYDKCEIVEAAAWTETASLPFRSEAGREAGGRIHEAGHLTVEAVTLNELVLRTFQPDYVKMDIEGAERMLLNDQTEWAVAVQEIRVECHGSYTIAECARDLERLGFRTEPRPERWARPTVIGYRTDAALPSAGVT